MIILPQNQPRVVIRDELVNETRIHRASGVATILHDPPCRMFFIDLIDLDGDHVSDAGGG